MSVAVELDRETDITRGDIIVSSGMNEASDHLASVSRARLADLVWLDSDPLNPSASYVMRAGPLEVPVRVEQVRFVMDLDKDRELPAPTLRTNDIGRVEITCDRPVLLDAYEDSRDTGGFILCDRRTGRTVAAGMELEPLRRESNVTRHSFVVTRDAREKANGTRAGVLWLTGLPGSGKSTIADTAERMLFERGIRSYVLDGDTVRQTLSEDLGFSPEDRRENVRRVARTAQLMMDAGLIVIVSLVSPFGADRAAARALFANSDFAEVFVDTPLSVCQERDPKGLYAKAAASLDSHMTGAGQAYEVPESPELHLNGTDALEENAAKIVSWVMVRRESLRAE
jgi:bifunctional enzyme CysN/CysC